VANSRTLEQKISDAGPNPQRVDPHILSPVRQQLLEDGVIKRLLRGNGNWYHLTDMSPSIVDQRLDRQLPVWNAICQQSTSMRVGQALEIATYRALIGLPSNAHYFGRITDLNDHDDSSLYRKDEPPSYLGNRSIPNNKRLDFLVHHQTAGYLGLECKNIREWLYPSQTEIKETLNKCIALDCVPVFIARRIPYVTFRLLWTCGCLMHQTYNQLFPLSAQTIAADARNKDLLGYHDIRIGNLPDRRLTAFIQKNMLDLASEARARFERYKDLLADFASGELYYAAFAARVRRRESNLNEDFDEQDTYENLDPYDI
jgi:hypothetical protein